MSVGGGNRVVFEGRDGCEGRRGGGLVHGEGGAVVAPPAHDGAFPGVFLAPVLKVVFLVCPLTLAVELDAGVVGEVERAGVCRPRLVVVDFSVLLV